MTTSYAEFRQKSVRQDVTANDVVHFFSTRFAQQVAYVCYRAGLTPNAVTFLFLIVGFASAISLHLGLPILCYILWRLHIILDMADGSLARAEQRFSKTAMGFDRSNHIIINTTILMASLNHGGHFYATNALVVAFYLNYFFSRNYYSGKQHTQQLSYLGVLVKNVAGLEGYILTQCVLIAFAAQELVVWVDLAYASSFALTFSMKLFRFIRPQQEG